jgi:hypothetical protein
MSDCFDTIPHVQRVFQVSLAVMALLQALVVGPETHVHQGEGPDRETVVHVHFGVVGHVHSGRSSGSGFSSSDDGGVAVYLNAYSSITTHATAVPILISQPLRVLTPAFTAEATFPELAVNVHAPPLIGSRRPLWSFPHSLVSPKRRTGSPHSSPLKSYTELYT